MAKKTKSLTKVRERSSSARFTQKCSRCSSKHCCIQLVNLKTLVPKSELGCSAKSLLPCCGNTCALGVSRVRQYIRRGIKELHIGLVCEKVPWLSCISSSMLHTCAMASCWPSGKYNLTQSNLLHSERRLCCFLTLASECPQISTLSHLMWIKVSNLPCGSLLMSSQSPAPQSSSISLQSYTCSLLIRSCFLFSFPITAAENFCGFFLLIP